MHGVRIFGNLVIDKCTDGFWLLIQFGGKVDFHFSLRLTENGVNRIVFHPTGHLVAFGMIGYFCVGHGCAFALFVSDVE